VPSLAERRDDIAALARHFCERWVAKHKLPSIQMSDGALRAAEAAEWPGNVRALANAVERAVLRADHEGVLFAERRHLFPDGDAPATRGGAGAKPGGGATPLTFQDATRTFQAARPWARTGPRVSRTTTSATRSAIRTASARAAAARPWRARATAPAPRLRTAAADRPRELTENASRAPRASPTDASGRAAALSVSSQRAPYQARVSGFIHTSSSGISTGMQQMDSIPIAITTVPTTCTHGRRPPKSAISVGTRKTSPMPP
jgi:hypothetical protein